MSDPNQASARSRGHWFSRGLSGAIPALLAGAMAVAGAIASADDDDVPNYRVRTIVQTVKPHDTDAVRLGESKQWGDTARALDSVDGLNIWIASNEGNAEVAPGDGGITVFLAGSNTVIATLSVECEQASIPVIKPDGSVWGIAPCGAEGHPRHPHGLDINALTKRAYQVLEHSGLKWNANRSAIEVATTTDEESGLLVEIDIANPGSPRIVRGWLLGHAAEESAVNENNGKVYVGNHEPSPGVTPASWVSVIKPDAKRPYAFIDLPNGDDIQGIEVDERRNLVFGTTHVGQKMYAFNSTSDRVAYKVDIRAAFDAQVGGVPAGSVLHMHDLTVDPLNGRVYQSIHTLAPPDAEEAPEGSTTTVDEDTEVRGHWVAQVDTARGNKVTIIDTPGVHAHFVAVDPTRHALLVSGEHTGNLGVVDTRTRKQVQVIRITPPDPVPPAPGEAVREPEVHGVNISRRSGTVYVSDESDWNQTVTVLRPTDD